MPAVFLFDIFRVENRLWIDSLRKGSCMNKNKRGFCCVTFPILILVAVLTGCARLQLLPEVFSRPQNVIALCVVTESHASISIPETENPEIVDENVARSIVEEFEKSCSVKATSFSIEKKDVPGKPPRISGIQITFAKK